MDDNFVELDGGGHTAPVCTMATKIKLPWTLALAAAWLLSATTRAAEANGLAVKFTAGDGKVSDLMVLPNLWLYVEDGKPATPFLAPGKFTAVFEGSIVGDLRGSFIFKTEELGGTLKLEINGATVLESSAAGALSKPVQINKGANAVKATFTSAGRGASFLRVGWTEKGTNVNPIPNSAITHASTPELLQAETVYLGRELFLEHRCAKCHTGKFASPVPELAMDAPLLEGIGARRNFEWLRKWVFDPKSTRASVHMPKLLHGQKAKLDAEAVALFLSSLADPPAVEVWSDPGLLKTISRVQTSPENKLAIDEITKRSGVNAKAVAGDGNERPADQNQESKPIFERLHCISCHNAPDKSENDAAEISLKHVAEKFADGQLVEFLKAPERHFVWIRMPNFKLADAEAKELAAFLLKHADQREAGPKATGGKGKELVQTLGCLNCHPAGKLENKFTAPGLAGLAKEAKGCLAATRGEESKAPDFGFSAKERAALLAFLKTDFASLSRHSPLEFAARETRLLSCSACHGQIELIPAFDVLGGKLKPEWAADFIAGQPFKIRADKHPKGELWTEARMPAFRSRAKLLAESMAMQQGYPPVTPAEGPVDDALAKAGHKLAGKDGGLSCISCHAVNAQPATDVFESEGINFGLSVARLQRSFFFRWMRLPASVDPQTKMPAFWDDSGKSPLAEILDGDSEKQINAVWHYLRLGEKMPKPVVPE